MHGAETYYRIVFKQNLNNVMQSAQNPEGRFHHSGQPALYTSLTATGAQAALGYYAKADDPARLIVELAVSHANVFDLRDAGACTAFGITASDAIIRWQAERAAGQPATTWQISDTVRDTGADGMIYPSSSSSDIFHMVLFRWNNLGGAHVATMGTPQPCILDKK